MNPIKTKFPFIDLLKPEQFSVLRPTLMTLGASVNVGKGVIAFSGSQWAKMRRWTKWTRPRGLLSDGGANDTASKPTTERRLRKLLREVNDGAFSVSSRDNSEVTHLRRAESYLRQNLDPLDLIPSEVSDSQLGILDEIWARMTGKEPHEVLRVAIDHLVKDQNFELGHEDETFKRLDETVGSDVQFLIAGHTHFERAILRPGNSSVYFNSGTWARRIRFLPATLASEVTFKPVFDALQAGTMDALKNLLLRKPTVVSLTQNGRATLGKLRYATATGWEMIPNSKYSM
ncbi:MAG: hypothetical protein IAG10_31025 [Planctomycetaceae bacterium]|nr:hypothetical protein [Planctomycetaceae bacterium]